MKPTKLEAVAISQAFSTGMVESMITSPTTGKNSKIWENGVKYFYTNDSGTKQGTANAGDLASTSNDLDVNRITFGTPLLASSFQVQLDLDGNSVHKVNSVGVEYRPLYKRVT